MLVSAVGAQRFTLQQRAVIGRIPNARLRQLHLRSLRRMILLRSEWRTKGIQERHPVSPPSMMTIGAPWPLHFVQH